MRLEYPILMDGGLSNVLKSLGCNVNHKLWTANLLDKDPESIVKAHLSYLKAGARCILTASYQASIEGFLENDYTIVQAEKLLLRSVELAETARREFHKGTVSEKIIIAASIGPYGAYLADGSEYTGKYQINEKELMNFHLRRFKVLEKSKADIYACETIPAFVETKILNEIIMNLDKPAWISFTCRDNKHLQDGTLIGGCISLLKDNPNIFAVGVNCTDPSFISGLIKEIKAVDSTKKIVVYPNSGDHYDPITKSWSKDASTEHFIEQAREWMNLGANIIGGCCNIGPDQIKQLNNNFFHQNT